LLDSSSKFAILVFADDAHADQQRSQADSCEFSKLIIKIELVLWADTTFDDAVCPLHVHLDHSAASDNHRHPLAVRSEGKDLQQLENLLFLLANQDLRR
jgi:hypothetical protein